MSHDLPKTGDTAHDAIVLNIAQIRERVPFRRDVLNYVSGKSSVKLDLTEFLRILQLPDSVFLHALDVVVQPVA
jgi:hypothetical protein